MARRRASELAPNALRFLLLGAFNSAIPFTLFAYAALSITAGLASILNATVPLFAALVGWLWLRERLTCCNGWGLRLASRACSGCLRIAPASSQADTDGRSPPGCWHRCPMRFPGSLVKRYFAHVQPLAVATGSQIAASALLLPITIFYLPAAMPGLVDWLALIALGVLCTGLAYALYFRLIARVGPTKTMAVTFLIPAFAIVWGVVFLAESVTSVMLGGCAVILIGTALATQLLFKRYSLRERS